MQDMPIDNQYKSLNHLYFPELYSFDKNMVGMKINQYIYQIIY